MITTQLEDAARLGKFPITTTELDEKAYQRVLAEPPLFRAETKEESRDVIQTLEHVCAFAASSYSFLAPVAGVVFLNEERRFALFAGHSFALILVVLDQSNSAALTWLGARERLQASAEAVAWYEAGDVKVLSSLLKGAVTLHAAVVDEALMVAGVLETEQRFLICLSRSDRTGLPVQLVSSANRATPVSIVFSDAATLVRMKKRWREATSVLRKQQGGDHDLVKMHIYADPGGSGTVLYQFPQLSLTPMTAANATVVAPFDLVALYPEFLVSPERGSVTMYVPPAELGPGEAGKPGETFVRKSLHLYWTLGQFSTKVVIAPMTPFHVR